MARDAEPRIPSPLATEARELVASARALLEELVEEGVDQLEELVEEGVDQLEELVEKGVDQLEEPVEKGVDQLEEPVARAQAPSRPPREPPRIRPAPSEGGQLGLMGDDAPWGEEPTLEDVRQALGDCTRCRLCEGRTQIVFGDGSPSADLMFIGEGPGAEEDRRGLPFVGRAGELLTQMIENGLGIARRDVYICNIVKCRPPENRTPLADEAGTCRPFLDGQISAIRPRVLIALGKPAASQLLGRDVAITRVRGTWQEYRGIPLMPTFHPAFVLRQYTPQNRRLVWNDLKAALERSRD